MRSSGIVTLSTHHYKERMVIMKQQIVTEKYLIENVIDDIFVIRDIQTKKILLLSNWKRAIKIGKEANKKEMD
jgi:hypothetical protein